MPTTFNIAVNCNITPDPRMSTKTENIELYAYNENGTDYWNKTKDIYDVNDNLNKEEIVGKAQVGISLISPTSLLTSESITNYDEKESIVVAPQIAEVAKEQRTATINVEIKNNYSSTISDVKILGRIPFANNSYVINGKPLNSSFTVAMKSAGIALPEKLKEKAVVYYTENENANKDLNDSNNGWTRDVQDFSRVKSYLIDLSDYTLQVSEAEKFTYRARKI